MRTVASDRRSHVSNAYTQSVMRELASRGQSVWLDHFRRDMIRSGELSALVADGIRGLTCNPTIYSHVAAGLREYNGVIGAYGSSSATDWQILDALLIRDVQDAADIFLPTYENSAGAEGFVSIDVAPRLVRNANELIAEARRLWRAVNRPNVMIKIPGTPLTWAAIERCLCDGINVNVTLLFSLEDYRTSIRIMLRALDERVMMGQPIDRVASAASFFVNWVDTEINRFIDGSKGALAPLRNLAGIATAWLIGTAYVDVSESKRWKMLEARDARLQRPLWACSGSDNPVASTPSGFTYVESLVVPGSIAALSPTNLADLGHGEIRDGPAQLGDARRIMNALARGGISFADICRSLTERGLWSSARSLDKLLEEIAHRRKMLSGNMLNFFQ